MHHLHVPTNRSTSQALLKPMHGLPFSCTPPARFLARRLCRETCPPLRPSSPLPAFVIFRCVVAFFAAFLVPGGVRASSPPQAAPAPRTRGRGLAAPFLSSSHGSRLLCGSALSVAPRRVFDCVAPVIHRTRRPFVFQPPHPNRHFTSFPYGSSRCPLLLAPLRDFSPLCLFPPRRAPFGKPLPSRRVL